MFKIEVQKDEQNSIVTGPVTCPHCGVDYDQSFRVKTSDVIDLNEVEIDQYLRMKFWEDEEKCYFCLEDGERRKADAWERKLDILRGK